MQLHESLEEIFQNVLDDDEISLTNDTRPVDLPGWDSLAHVNVMFSIEDAFGIQFADGEFAELKSIGELKDVLVHRTRPSS